MVRFRYTAEADRTSEGDRPTSEAVGDHRRQQLRRRSKAIEVVQENATIAAKRLGFTWQIFQPSAANDFDEIFARLAAEHFDAAYLTSAPFNNQNGPRIIQLALPHLIPSVGEGAGWAKGGLLLSYGQDSNFTFARASEYVDKILRGA